jgi:N-methylhydantoinase A
LHGAELAPELNMPHIIIPIRPGVNSAVGLLKADFRYDFSRTFLKIMSRIDFNELHHAYRDMEKMALDQMGAEKIDRDRIIFLRSADIRYYGQGYEVEVPVPNGVISEQHIAEIKRGFNKTHTQLYGYDLPREEMEVVYLRLAAIGEVSKPEFFKSAVADEDPSSACKGKRDVYMDGEFKATTIFDRSLLHPNNAIPGPAIVEQFDSTTLIKPGQVARVDDYLNLIVTIQEIR